MCSNQQMLVNVTGPVRSQLLLTLVSGAASGVPLQTLSNFLWQKCAHRGLASRDI